jgi:cobalt-zinc-cadmium efflux system membrane fusion protein
MKTQGVGMKRQANWQSKSTVAMAAMMLCGWTGVGCNRAKPAADAADSSSASIVETTVVQSSSVTDRLTLPATITADPTRVVHILSPIAGRLEQLTVRPGMEVTKGQVIGQIQSSDVAQARSDFEKATIESLRSDRQLARGKQLLDHEVLSQREYDDLQAAASTAKSEVDRTRQRIRMLGFSETGNSDVAALRAPETGAVLDIGSATGEMTRSLDNATSIATIANLDTVWVLGDVFERDLALIKPNEVAEITLGAYPGQTWRGTVTNVGDAFDPTTRTLKVRIVLANPGHKLKPQMFANISLARDTHSAVLVPATAVLHEASTTYVFVAGGDGKYQRRAVTVGSSHDGTVEVLSGLSAGDKVVTTGAALLRGPEGQ